MSMEKSELEASARTTLQQWKIRPSHSYHPSGITSQELVSYTCLLTPRVPVLYGVTDVEREPRPCGRE